MLRKRASFFGEKGDNGRSGAGVEAGGEDAELVPGGAFGLRELGFAQTQGFGDRHLPGIGGVGIERGEPTTAEVFQVGGDIRLPSPLRCIERQMRPRQTQRQRQPRAQLDQRGRISVTQRGIKLPQQLDRLRIRQLPHVVRGGLPQHKTVPRRDDRLTIITSRQRIVTGRPRAAPARATPTARRSGRP